MDPQSIYVENLSQECDCRSRSIASLRVLPPGRSLLVIAAATLLAVADVLPANPYIDPDLLEFTLTVGLGVWRLRSRFAIALKARVCESGGIAQC